MAKAISQTCMLRIIFHLNRNFLDFLPHMNVLGYLALVQHLPIQFNNRDFPQQSFWSIYLNASHTGGYFKDRCYNILLLQTARLGGSYKQRRWSQCRLSSTVQMITDGLDKKWVCEPYARYFSKPQNVLIQNVASYWWKALKRMRTSFTWCQGRLCWGSRRGSFWGDRWGKIVLHTELFPSLLFSEGAFSGVVDSLVHENFSRASP